MNVLQYGKASEAMKRDSRVSVCLFADGLPRVVVS